MATGNSAVNEGSNVACGLGIESCCCSHSVSVLMSEQHSTVEYLCVCMLLCLKCSAAVFVCLCVLYSLLDVQQYSLGESSPLKHEC